VGGYDGATRGELKDINPWGFGLRLDICGEKVNLQEEGEKGGAKIQQVPNIRLYFARIRGAL